MRDSPLVGVHPVLRVVLGTTGLLNVLDLLLVYAHRVQKEHTILSLGNQHVHSVHQANINQKQGYHLLVCVLIVHQEKNQLQLGRLNFQLAPHVIWEATLLQALIQPAPFVMQGNIQILLKQVMLQHVFHVILGSSLHKVQLPVVNVHLENTPAHHLQQNV